MIEPTSKDIGRFVVYIDDRPGWRHAVIESGRLVSFSETACFVAFPKRQIAETMTQGCNRCDLVWLDDLVALAKKGESS